MSPQRQCRKCRMVWTLEGENSGGPYMSRLPGVNNLSKSDKFNPSIIQSIKVKYLIAKGKVKHLVAVSSNLGKDIMTNDTYIVYLVPAPRGSPALGTKPWSPWRRWFPPTLQDTCSKLSIQTGIQEDTKYNLFYLQIKQMLACVVNQKNCFRI